MLSYLLLKNMFPSVTIEKLRMKPSVEMGLKVALDLQVINKAFLLNTRLAALTMEKTHSFINT